ncbi:MAG: orotidine 5'-phosphate decarboxylase / HUMPS family protein [Desulfurococcaceae archaeon]
MEKILQIALDMTELVKAVDLSLKIVSTFKCKNIWLEAGTPLLKAWGKLAVKSLKNLTNCFVVADTKTIDAAQIEAETMFKNGADAITILAVADDEVLREAMNIKKEYNDKLLIIDLISHPNPYQRAMELSRFEPDVLLYHVGISVQKARKLTVHDLLSEISRIKNELAITIGVAGGLKPGLIKPVIEQGADIIVVGGAITKARDPLSIVSEIFREMSIML